LTEDIVSKLSSVFGGVPRFVLFISSVRLEEQRLLGLSRDDEPAVIKQLVFEYLQRKIESVDTGALEKLVSGVISGNERNVSHALVHFYSEQHEDIHFALDERKAKVASQFVLQLIMQKFGHAVRHKQHTFDVMARGSPKFAVVLGWMYKGKVHNIFTTREIDADANIRTFAKQDDKTYLLGAEQTIIISECDAKYFFSLDDLLENIEQKNDDRLLHIPVFPNQGGWDSCRLSLSEDFHLDVYQITLAREHRVKTKYVQELRELFVKSARGKELRLTEPKQVKIRFIFVVTDRNFPKYETMQKFQKPDDTGPYLVQNIPYTVSVLKVGDGDIEKMMTLDKFKDADLAEGAA
jgi:hypothetical protein